MIFIISGLVFVGVAFAMTNGGRVLHRFRNYCKLSAECVCRYVGVDIIFGHINESPVSDTDLVGRSFSLHSSSVLTF